MVKHIEFLLIIIKLILIKKKAINEKREWFIFVILTIPTGLYEIVKVL